MVVPQARAGNAGAVAPPATVQRVFIPGISDLLVTESNGKLRMIQGYARSPAL